MDGCDGKPGFSLTGIIGARYMAVANKMTSMTDTGFIVPLTLGIDLKPRLGYHARLDLGGTVGVEFPAVCGICASTPPPTFTSAWSSMATAPASRTTS